jgi:hypothetical protein
VFSQFDIPVKDEQEFNLAFIKQFPAFWNLHEKTVEPNSNLSLLKSDFFAFAQDNDIQMFYYFQPVDSISKENVKFTSILKQSYRYLLKAQT